MVHRPAANKEVRDRTAVDAANATILLIELKCNRFEKQKKKRGPAISICLPEVTWSSNASTKHPPMSVQYHLYAK